jgi:predicted N-acyltransferase
MLLLRNANACRATASLEQAACLIGNAATWGCSIGCLDYSNYCCVHHDDVCYYALVYLLPIYNYAFI